jgi:hypothetical protein
LFQADGGAECAADEVLIEVLLGWTEKVRGAFVRVFSATH